MALRGGCGVGMARKVPGGAVADFLGRRGLFTAPPNPLCRLRVDFLYSSSGADMTILGVLGGVKEPGIEPRVGDSLLIDSASIPVTTSMGSGSFR